MTELKLNSDKNISLEEAARKLNCDNDTLLLKIRGLFPYLLKEKKPMLSIAHVIAIQIDLDHDDVLLGKLSIKEKEPVKIFGFLIKQSWNFWACIAFPLVTGLNVWNWQLWVYLIPLVVLATISIEYQIEKSKEDKE